MSLPIASIEEAQKLPGALLWKASKLWQNNLHASLTELGLSSTNAVILSNILHLELDHKEVTQTRLATMSSVDRMTASTILSVLIKKGFVERRVNSTDKRAFELSLTDKGREVAYEALHRIASAHQKFFGPMQSKELTQLVAGLSTLLDIHDRKIPEMKDKEEKI